MAESLRKGVCVGGGAQPFDLLRGINASKACKGLQNSSAACCWSPWNSFKLQRCFALSLLFFFFYKVDLSEVCILTAVT